MGTGAVCTDMTKRSLLAVGVVAPLLLAVSGCGEPTRTAAPDVRSTHLAGQQVVRPQEPRAADGGAYHLLTHCGIEWAKIRGTFWHTEPISDGNGNPPRGWRNPFQSGRLTFRTATTAIFTSAAGQVTFHHTARTEPPYLCS